MSIIEDLGARLSTTADDLPVDLIVRAVEQLRVATERLRWVRQASRNPLAVPELSAATEHAQQAGHALQVAQEQLAAYLSAIGLSAEGASTAPVRPTRRPGPADQPDTPVDDRRTAPEPAAVPRWWSSRVAELTGRTTTAPPAGGPRPATDPEELLRRVSSRVRAGDRERLHAELRAVDANVGLGLAAVATPALRRLAGELLGHSPRVADLPRLRELTANVRDLLPGLPAAVLDTLLSRVCRTPPPRQPHSAHPADQAVAAGVLTGLLVHRLGRPDASRDTHG